MNAYDFAPLFRSSIGFDRVMNALEKAGRNDQAGFPPYDIVRTDENRYRITIVAPGFTTEDLVLEARENALSVSASPRGSSGDVTYLHRGIAQTGFSHTFQLADHVKVSGATLEHGLLTIDLVREVPEALKPRRIEVRSGTNTPAAIVQDSDSQHRNAA